MRSVVRPHIQNLSFAMVLALGACSGKVGGGGNLTGTGAGTGAGAGPGTGGAIGTVGTAGAGQSGGSIGTGAGGDGALASCPTTAITPTPLRRLTQFEYANIGPQPAGRRHDAGQRSARRRGHRRLQQQRGRADRVVAARREVRAGLRSAGQVGGAEPVDARPPLRHGDDAARTPARWTSRRASGGAPSGGRRPTEDEQILMAAYTAGSHRRQLRRGHRGDDPRGAAVAAFPLPARDDGARRARPRTLVPLSQYELATRLSYLHLGGGPGRRAARRRRPRRARPTRRPSRRRRARCSPIRRRASAITDFFNQWIGHQPPRHHHQERHALPGVLDAVRDAMKRGDARVRPVRAVDGRSQAAARC